MSNTDNVVALDSHRGRPFVRTVLEVADKTGSKPFHCLASDGKHYWCKRPFGPNGIEEVVNEVTSSLIGEAIGAPIRPWTMLDIPDELVGSMVGEGEGRYRLQKEPVFASLHLPYAVNEDTVKDVARDHNTDRFPLLIALWLLCNAEDIQVLYDNSADRTAWSIDHGFWFGSHEFPWNLDGPEYRSGRPVLPPMREKIPEECWDQAIGAVDHFDRSFVTDKVLASVPDAWGVDDEDCRRLVNYAYGRKSYAVEELRDLQKRHGRR